jgi:hypothetical protein
MIYTVCRSSRLESSIAALFGVLRDPAAERPVLLDAFDEVDDHVVAPQLQLGVDVVGDARRPLAMGKPS